MPYKLHPPKAGRWANWRVRGTENGFYLNKSTGTSDRKEAQRFLTQWKEDARKEALTGGKKVKQTFASASIAYMQADHPTRFLARLIEHFGETPLSEIGQTEIDAAGVALYPNAKPATRNRQVYSPVSAILRHAGVTIPLRRPRGALGERRLDWLKPKEAFRLLKAADETHPTLGLLATFLLYTGARLSEALRLKWENVDFSRATAHVGVTKNGLPISFHCPPQVLGRLEAIPRDRRNGRVFRLTKSGRLYDLLSDACRDAGILLPKRSAFHILRHTHATWRRLYTGADTSALTATGLWKSRNAAARYEHIDSTEEARKSDLLPTPPGAIMVRDGAEGPENL